MDLDFGFNGNLQYPSLNNSNQLDRDNVQNINNLNYMNENNINNNSKTFISSNKLFHIKESNTDIFIQNKNKNIIIKIPKPFNQKMFLVENEYEYLNVKSNKEYQADSIFGIFNINENKYLAIVTSSKVAAKVLGSFIFSITSIELIKITYNIESINDINIINDIKNFFLSKNFYYSNDYDLSLSLYSQYRINSYDYNGNNSNKKQLTSKYLINSSLLKYFVDNNIPECFYSIIIYGYVGCKIDVDLDENNKNLTVDIIIIERYYKKNIIINNEIPEHVKQIELICTFKNKVNKNKNTFSFIFYVNSESIKNLNYFDPSKSNIIEDFKQYRNIICIINNLSNNDNSLLKNVISKNNENLLNNKIKLIELTSNWDKNLFFDTNNDSYNYINFYLNNSNNEVQKNVFWFIDINNYFSDDDCCFNAFIRIMWKAIQKEINYLKLNIDIGLFNKNNDNYICKKFKEIIMKYHNDLDENKKSLYNNINRAKIQEIFDCFLNPINNDKKDKSHIYNTFRNNDNKIYNNNDANNYNNNNITSRDKEINKDYNNFRKKEYINNDNKKIENENIKKIKLLCVTWNIAGISYKSDYNITELFTQNIFYHKNKPPDIIVVAIQEIIKLSLTSVLSLVSNQENVKAWTDNILYTIRKVFPETEYYQLKCMDLVGIYILVLVKKDLKQNIYLLDSNTTKTGVYGTMGNKGFFTLTLKCFDNFISFGSGHFEAGQSKNDDRIDTLYQLLNKPINIKEDYDYLTFKDMEYWVILGDLNFRISLNFEDAFVLIREKKYDILYGLDQFNSFMENNKFLKDNINEKEIKFDPTYKFVKGSNEYAYDEEKVRVPAWTDRIFYCKNKGIKMLTYDSIKNIKYSDHRPVVGTFLINCTSTKSKSTKKIIKKNENPYEKIFKEEKSGRNNINDLIDIDNKVTKQSKEINKFGGNNYMNDNKNKFKPNQYGSVKTKNKEQIIKMNYRGINFNTEINLNDDIMIKNNNEIKNNNKQNYEQDIYQFFENKNKNYKNSSNSNILFNNNNISSNQNLIFESFNNHIDNNNINNNQNILLDFNNNDSNQGMFRSNIEKYNNFSFNNQNNYNQNNQYQNNQYQNNNNNNNIDNNILNFFQ